MTLSQAFGVSETYAALWKMVIRPPRACYAIDDLGPSRFLVNDRLHHRVDFQLENDRGFKLECSHFRPEKFEAGYKRPCVVYCHANCSSRMEALAALRGLLERDIMVFTMDFSGSGWSDGEFISVGHWEQQDLKVVIAHLRTLSFVSSIALWGRSMGAVTAILRAAEDPSIAACVLDSPFKSIRLLAKELVASKRIVMPSFLTELAFQLVRSEVQSRAEFDMDTLSAIDLAPHINVPALFAVAADDNFVLNHHSEDLLKAWGCKDRTLVRFSGHHNSVRPHWFLDAATSFLEKRLLIAHKFAAPAWALVDSLAVRKMPLEKVPLPRPTPVEITFSDMAGNSPRHPLDML
jgi:pimeloyl-ACP methyl ester carboxylesterase